eukprot:1151995-Pelagomonas_calceolata.AAC.4
MLAARSRPSLPDSTAHQSCLRMQQQLMPTTLFILTIRTRERPHIINPPPAVPAAHLQHWEVLQHTSSTQPPAAPAAHLQL